MVTPISYNTVDLNDEFFSSDLQGVFDADKKLVMSDMLEDGQSFGRSKATERKLVLRIAAGGHDLTRLAGLNQMVIGNAAKPLVIETNFGRLIGYAEVTSFAWSDDTPLFSTCQLTMPDPHWYAVQADTLSLEPHIANGVLFSTETIMVLCAGNAAGANRDVLDAGNCENTERTFLRGPKSDV